MKKIPKSTIVTGIFFLLLCIAFVFLLYKDGYFAVVKRVSSGESKANYLDNAQYTQRETTFALSKIEKSDIAFLGDSITARINWEEFYPDYVVINRGIDSDVVEGAMNRLESVTKTKPDKVFIMLGINDIRQGIDAERSLTYYAQILFSLHKALPDSDIYVQSVLPVAKKTGIDNHTVEDFNAQLKDFAESYDFTYIDIFSDMITEDYDLPASYSIDGVHMTGDGYQIWLDKLSEYID